MEGRWSMVAHILCLILLLPALAACAYYLILAVVGLWARGRRADSFATGSDRSFVILIPAHNEEAILERVLRSCAELDYPRKRFQVVVIADNCSDGTAAIARAAGAVCLERADPEQPGKGHAIAHGLQHVLPQPWDAVVVVDADCTLERHALQAFTHRLNRGAKVLQARVAAANVDDSAISYAVAVGNVLENDLIYLPRSRLGAALTLRGTGMVFASEVLRTHPWQAFSVVEDREYSLRLLEAGIPVCWVQEVTVASIYPAGREQLQVQRSRWSAALQTSPERQRRDKGVPSLALRACVRPDTSPERQRRDKGVPSLSLRACVRPDTSPERQRRDKGVPSLALRACVRPDTSPERQRRDLVGSALPWRTRAELLASRLLLSRPLVLLELLLTAGSAVLCLLVAPGAMSNLLAGMTALVVLLQALYFGLGVLLLGLTWRRLGLLLAAPAVVGRLILITLAGLLGRLPATWRRTPRGQTAELPLSSLPGLPQYR